MKFEHDETPEGSFQLRMPFALFCLFLLIRPYYAFLLSSGGDEMRLWQFCRELTLGIAPMDITHNVVRFGMALPTMVCQVICGHHYLVAYLPPLLFSLFTICFLYNLFRRFLSVPVGSGLLLFFVCSPQFIKSSAALTPTIFGMGYFSGLIYFLYAYDKTRKMQYLAACGVMALFLYFTKVPFLFLVIGLLFGVFLFYGVRAAIVLAGILLLGYAVEHLLIYAVSGEPLGRLGVILSHHGQTIYADVYDRSRGQILVAANSGGLMTKLAALACYKFNIGFDGKVWLLSCFPVMAIPFAFRSRVEKILGISMAVWLLQYYFGFKSLDPLLPLELNMSRYTYIGLPAYFVLAGYLYRKIISDRFAKQKLLDTAAAGLLFLSAGGLLYLNNFNKIDYLADYYFLRDVEKKACGNLAAGGSVYVPVTPEVDNETHNKSFRWLRSFYLDLNLLRGLSVSVEKMKYPDHPAPCITGDEVVRIVNTKRKRTGRAVFLCVAEKQLVEATNGGGARAD